MTTAMNWLTSWAHRRGTGFHVDALNRFSRDTHTDEDVCSLREAANALEAAEGDIAWQGELVAELRNL